MPNTSSKPLLTSLCAMTFQGNATNDLQQDAFFFIDTCYHEKLGITPIAICGNAFCVAVSDGVAKSPLSEYASQAVVKAVAQQWQSYLTNPATQKPIINIEQIHEQVAHAPQKYKGACATLAVLYRAIHSPNQVTIKHIGDSRVYLQCDNKWQCLTRDHNVLNELIDDDAQAQGKAVNFSDYNRTGMANYLYSLTDCLIIDSDLDSNPIPRCDSQTISIQAGDCFVVCTDGVHDLVPCDEWQMIDKNTNLQDWLKNLRKQVYKSEGRAYDNATAILAYFSEE